MNWYTDTQSNPTQKKKTISYQCMENMIWSSNNSEGKEREKSIYSMLFGCIV